MKKTIEDGDNSEKPTSSGEQMYETTNQEPLNCKKRRLETSDEECSVGNKRRCLGAGDALTTQPPLFPPLTSSPNDPADNLKVTLIKKEITQDINQNDEVDSQLAEELLDNITTDECNSNPIPLLTPPATPVLLKSDESVVQMCEWPCNLTVDNALTSAIQLRALSPSSLMKLEETAQNGESLFASTQEDKELGNCWRDINIIAR